MFIYFLLYRICQLYILYILTINYLKRLLRDYNHSQTLLSFISPSLSWLGNLNKIRALHLSDINLVGEIPLSLGNMTRLSQLHLSKNRLTGKIPLWISNLTQLTLVHLRHNELHGPIPESMSKLVNLEELKLEYNQLSGTIKFSMFASLKHLTMLQIRRNNLTVLTTISDNTTLPKFKYLVLGDCNLK